MGIYILECQLEASIATEPLHVHSPRVIIRWGCSLAVLYSQLFPSIYTAVCRGLPGGSTGVLQRPVTPVAGQLSQPSDGETQDHHVQRVSSQHKLLSQHHGPHRLVSYCLLIFFPLLLFLPSFPRLFLVTSVFLSFFRPPNPPSLFFFLQTVDFSSYHSSFSFLPFVSVHLFARILPISPTLTSHQSSSLLFPSLSFVFSALSLLTTI